MTDGSWRSYGERVAESVDGHLAYVIELPVSRHVTSLDPLNQMAV